MRRKRFKTGRQGESVSGKLILLDQDAVHGFPIRPIRLQSGPILGAIWGMSIYISVLDHPKKIGDLPGLRVGLFALALTLFATACSAPIKTEVEVSEATLNFTNEAIVFFPTGYKKSSFATAHIVQCLETELEKHFTPKPKFMHISAFHDAMIPLFPVGTAPLAASELNDLLARPIVRQRISSLNVRYLIVISGGTVRGGGFPGGVPTPFGIFGLGWREGTTRLNAVIWDLASGEKAGKLSVISSGTTGIFAIMMPIILFIAFTEDDACEALAAELGQRLFGPSASPPRLQAEPLLQEAAPAPPGSKCATFEPGESSSAELGVWRRSALNGDANAQHDLGMRCLGEDDFQAVAWYRRAAAQGYADAQKKLGDMYRWGRGVPQDDFEATKWWRLAAEQGHFAAQSILKQRRVAP